MLWILFASNPGILYAEADPQAQLRTLPFRTTLELAPSILFVPPEAFSHYSVVNSLYRPFVIFLVREANRTYRVLVKACQHPNIAASTSY